MKDKIVKVLKILQIIVSIITFCMIFFAVNDQELGMILSNNLAFLPATLYAIFLALFIADFILKKGVYKYLIIIYFVEILIFISLLIQNDYILCNTTIMIVGIINAVTTTISYIKLINDKYNNLLPLGFFSTAHYYICFSVLLLIIAFGVISYFVFVKNNINLAYILIEIPFVLTLILFVMIKSNPLIKALNTINKKLDYESFTKMIDKLVPNNLNQDSRTYLEIVRANYMLVENKEEAIKYYENVGSISNRVYLYYYAIVRCNFSAFTHNKKGFDDALYILNNIVKKNNAQIEMSKAIWEIYNSNCEILNVEDIFNVNAPIPLTQLSNRVSLMEYYNSRGNINKAKEYANELKNCPFKQYRNSALKVLNGEIDEK